ncbi:MAG: hypothetical protein ACXVX9_00140 [Mycobacteriaceae bacterium]
MSTPSIGRIVQYTLNGHDAAGVNRRREDAQRHQKEHVATANGVVVHTGNAVSAGDVFPMVITRVWNSELVNGQVLLDGNDLLWVTSVHEGEGPRTFAWPTRS